MLKNIILSGVIVATSSFAHNTSEDQVCEGHLPESMEPQPIPLEGYSNHALTEEEFKDMIALGVEYYTDIVKGHGATLTIKNLWTDNTVNAMAGKQGSNWTVYMFGGYARLKGMTKDGLTSVMCHEIGHLVGGFPENSQYGKMANEGQSDYFAGHACFKRMFKDDLEVNATFRDKVQEYPKETCDAMYDTQEDKDLCYRTAVTGFELWSALSKRNPVKWGFNNKDKKVVSKTSHRHPQAQCRLDTALASGLCLDEWDDSKIPGKQNHNTYNCSRGKYVDDYRVGLRPKCWYKPDQSGGTEDPRD